MFTLSHALYNVGCVRDTQLHGARSEKLAGDSKSPSCASLAGRNLEAEMPTSAKAAKNLETELPTSTGP